MRIAIISDIHSNLEALTTAFEVINKRQVDQIVCLGDVVGYGANPSECLTAVRERCSLVVVGNHDRASTNLTEAEGFTTNARLAAEWTFSKLSADEKNYLQHLPYSAELEDLLLVHGSPYEPEEFHYILSVFDAVGAMNHFSQKICFIGHSHVPGIYTENGPVSSVRPEGKYLINVGSVGQPRDGNPKLSFGILDTNGWSYEHIRAEYDVERAAKKIVDAGLPKQLGQRLFAGV